MNLSRKFTLLVLTVLSGIGIMMTVEPMMVNAQEPTTCEGVTCENLPDAVCDPAGFTIELINFIPAPIQDSGEATYVYEVCAPATNGTCSNGNPAPCADHRDCVTGQYAGPATCSGECRIDFFHNLSHIDVYFPELGGIGSCLAEDTEIEVQCSKGSLTLGDGACASGDSPVAKCDSTNLGVGQCMTMTVTIAGELTGLGLGAAVTVTKAASECVESCIAGPSCNPCDIGQGGDAVCLTRTRGFWGTHPHIAADYDPVTVCGLAIDGQEAETCSTSEALCTNAKDRKQNPAYLQLVAQLVAAKLNLNATGALVPGAICSDFNFNEESIQEIIARCDTPEICNANKKIISESGCIEALDAFNNSEDTGFGQTPVPFDRPGPAQIGECKDARGNGKAIGYGLCE